MKIVGILPGKSKGAPEDDGLVAANGVRRVETIIRELAVVDECPLSVW